MSYYIQSTDYISGYVNRGDYIELGNIRVWNSPNGTNAAPRISTVIGTDNCWLTGRQWFYNGNYGTYVRYVSPITTTAAPFNPSENYATIGDTEEIIFTNGVTVHRVIYNVADGHLGTFISLERLSDSRPNGSIGADKGGSWVSNNIDFTYGNLKFRVGNTNMLQVSHASSAVRLVGQINVGYANGLQTYKIDLTTTTTPVYMGNPGWSVSGSSQAGATMVADFIDWTNNVRYKVTQILFTNNGNVSLNYHYICVEKYNNQV